MQWQPIETAPKDGTNILVYDGCEQVTVYWCVGSWQLVQCGGYADDSDPSGEPTHRMPLPEPPEKT